jgi:group I intron endonuclease
MTDICGIYSITNILNNKMYIGQSIHCYKRFNQHSNSLKKCGAIYLAIKKYGIENFEFDILEECDRDQLDNLE